MQHSQEQEDLQCPHEDDVEYYRVRLEWEYKGEKFRLIEVMCKGCGLFGEQVEVYDVDQDDWLFVDEYWNA